MNDASWETAFVNTFTVRRMILPDGDIFCVWLDGPERYGTSLRPEDLSSLG
jgi:hypothetical protein